MLRRRWPIVALCTLATAGGALALSLTQDKEYESSASLLFRPGAGETGLFDSSSAKSDVKRIAATNVELGGVNLVAERAAARLRSQDVDTGDVASSVDLSARGDSDLAAVTATTNDPVLSRRIANAVAQEYIEFRRRLDRGSIRDSQKVLVRQLQRLTPRQRATARGRTLRRAAQDLQVLAALRTGSAELVQRARANADPVSPRPKRAAGVGLIGGLLLGIAMAFVRELRDRRLNEVSDVEQALGLPILGRLPAIRASMGAGGHAVVDRLSDEAEAFRFLRANLRYLNVERAVNSVLVASAASGEGTSSVSLNLAIAEAQAGRDALLIDADLRTGVVGEALDLPADSGLSVLMNGGASIDDCAVSVMTSPGRLDVIPAGPAIPASAQLLESARMGALLDYAEARYDLVVIDAPPVLSVPDAVPLVTRVSGVLVVVRLRKTTSDRSGELCDRLRQLGAHVLGVVVSDTRRSQ